MGTWAIFGLVLGGLSGAKNNADFTESSLEYFVQNETHTYDNIRDTSCYYQDPLYERELSFEELSEDDFIDGFKSFMLLPQKDTTSHAIATIPYVAFTSSCDSLTLAGRKEKLTMKEAWSIQQNTREKIFKSPEYLALLKNLPKGEGHFTTQKTLKP